MGREPGPAYVRNPFRASAVVPVPGGRAAEEPVHGARRQPGAWLVSAALRAPAQLAPPTSSSVVVVGVVEVSARAQEWPRPVPLHSACSCSLVGRKDCEEQQCGQEGRRSSHGLLQLPPHVCLLHGRGFWCLRVLEEGASVVGTWQSMVERFQGLPRHALRGPGQGLVTHNPPQQRTAKQQTAQASAALHVMVDRRLLVE